MVDDVGIADRAVVVELGNGLGKAAVAVIQEGGEAAGGRSAVCGFGHIEGKGLAQLAEDVLGDLGVIVKVGGLFGLLDDVSFHIVGGVQAEVTGLAFFIGEAGGDICQHAQIVEGIGGLTGGDSVGSLDGFGDCIAGLGIIFRDHRGHQGCGGDKLFLCNLFPDRGNRNGGAYFFDQHTCGVEAVGTNYFARSICYDPLGNDAVVIVFIGVNILDFTVAGVREDFSSYSVIETVVRGDRRGTLGLYLGIQHALAVYIPIGIGDGVGITVLVIFSCNIYKLVFCIIVVSVGGFGSVRIGYLFCSQATVGAVGVLDRVALISRNRFDSAEFVQDFLHLLDAAVARENIFPFSAGFFCRRGDGLQDTGLDQTVFIGNRLVPT